MASLENYTCKSYIKLTLVTETTHPFLTNKLLILTVLYWKKRNLIYCVAHYALFYYGLNEKEEGLKGYWGYYIMIMGYVDLCCSEGYGLILIVHWAEYAPVAFLQLSSPIVPMKSCFPLALWIKMSGLTNSILSLSHA